jgi:hypothetical protein
MAQVSQKVPLFAIGLFSIEPNADLRHIPHAVYGKTYPLAVFALIYKVPQNKDL